MGRPRKPTALKELTGTVQPCRAVPDEPRPPVGLPDPSLAHLSPTARELWPQFADALLNMGVLTVADGPALTLLVEAFAEGIEARRVLEELGSPYYESVNQQTGATMVRMHPAAARASDADRRFVLLANQFGLTPAARTRVSMSIKKQDENPWEAL
jgi:P27 family predicted phage terminase small subunit